MNKLQLVGIASLLAAGLATGAQASTPCDSFEIKIKNQLADDLLVTRIKLHGADIQPGGLQKLNAKTEQVFTVNNSTDALPMKGDMVFHTLSLPSKEVKIQFDLTNAGLVCSHTNTSPAGDYAVEDSRSPGQVSYTISNK